MKFWGAILEHFGAIFGAKIGPKTIFNEVWCSKVIFPFPDGTRCFFEVWAHQNRSKTVPRGSWRGIFCILLSVFVFGPFWASFWCHFGSQNGAKLGQKSIKKMIKKSDDVQERPRAPQEHQGAPQEHPKGARRGAQGRFFSFSFACGAFFCKKCFSFECGAFQGEGSAILERIPL